MIIRYGIELNEMGWIEEWMGWDGIGSNGMESTIMNW